METKPWHPLLLRQIKKILKEVPEQSPCLDLLKRINETYYQFEEDRYLIENALALSSKELQEANTNLMAIFQSFPDIIFRLDFTGTILDIKGSVSAHFLLPPHKLLGKKIQTIPVQGVNKLFENALEEVKKHSPYSFEYQIKQNKQNKFFEARLVRISNKEVIAIVRDITSQKQTEQQLLQAQKLQVIDSLTSGLAHDFNNILTALKTNLEICLQKLVNPENIKYLERSLKAIDRASLLTRQLLNFSRPEELEPKTSINLNQLCTNVLNMVQNLLGKNITFKTDFQPGLWSIWGNSNQLEQVVMNLLINARDAMPQGGEITLITRNIHLSTENNSPLQDQVLLMVKDTGQGIPEEIKERIFEPFFTTKKKGKGTGLGLAMVSKIVYQHQGLIEVESRPNQGTTFKLYFKADPTSVSAASQDKEEEVLALRECPLLLLEDEDIIREATAEALREKNFSVYTASSISEAKRIFKEKEKELGLIISDIMLKDGNALEFIAWALKRRRIKTIFTSGYPEKEELIQELNPREFIYLQKPFSLRKLFTAIDALLNS